MRTPKVILILTGIVLGLIFFAVGCAGDQATSTPRPAPTAAPAATALPAATATPAPTAAPVATTAAPAAPAATAAPAPTAVPAAPAATAVPKPTSAPEPVPTEPQILSAGDHFWSKNNPLDDHYSAHIHSLEYDRLTNINEAGELVPMVATKWEQIEPLKWRITIRDDVKFQDGSSLTAIDAAFSITDVIENAGSNLRNWNNFASLEVVDATTFDINLLKLDVYVPYQLSTTWVVSKAHMDKVGRDGLTDSPSGSGPFSWTEWVAWDHTTAERVSGQHAFLNPSLDKITLWYIQAAETAIAGLRTGALEWAVASFAPEQAENLEGRGFLLKIQSTGMAGIHLAPMDACRLGYPTCDVKVRRALAMSIDRKLIADTLYMGYAVPLTMFGNPSGKNYMYDEPLLYDLVEAERLLEIAGYPVRDDGFRIDIEYVNWIPGTPDLMAQAISDMWKEIGVNVTYRKVDISVALRMWFRTDGTELPMLFQVMTGGPGPAFDNFNANRGFWCDDPTAKLCTFPYDNPEFLRLQEAIYNESDMDKRDQHIRDIHRVLIDDVPAIWTVSRPDFWIYKPYLKNVTGRGNAPEWDKMVIEGK